MNIRIYIEVFPYLLPSFYCLFIIFTGCCNVIEIEYFRLKFKNKL